MNLNPAVLALPVLLSLMSTSVAAAPVTYTYRADNAAGSLAGTAFGPGAVVVITINADTSAVAAETVLGDPGTCVASSSGTVSADGGTTTALTGTAYVCTQPDGYGAGIYNTAGSNGYLVMSPAAWTGVGDLTASFGPTPPTTPNALTSHGNTYTLSVTGGTFWMSAPLPAGAQSSAASSFGAVVSAPPSAASSVPVPAMAPWGAFVLAGFLALGALGRLAAAKRSRAR